MDCVRNGDEFKGIDYEYYLCVFVYVLVGSVKLYYVHELYCADAGFVEEEENAFYCVS